jgi:peroxiredoxin
MKEFLKAVFALCAALLLIVSGKNANAQFSFELTLKNNPYKQSYFCSVYGSKLSVIYSSKVAGDKISFSFKNNIPAGLYRLYLSDTVFVDVISSRDKIIRIESDAAHLADSLKVIEGNDNRNYYAYIKFRNNQLAKLASMMAVIKPADTKKLNPLADERVSFLQGCVTYEIQKFADSLYGLDTSAFVSKLILAQVVPNVNIEMLENPKGKFYNNDIEFLLVHFFDNIDFSDTAFLNTEIYYRTVKYYIEKLVLPRNVTGFNYGNAFILTKASVNKKVNRYVLSVLFDLYEYSQLEDVYLNLYENYLLKDTLAVTKERLKEIKLKAGIIKSLAPGSIAPDISAKDTLGKEIKISSMKGKLTMLFIWKPGDAHSDEAMTQLGDIYEKYKGFGLEVIAFALDTSETHFAKAIRGTKSGIINVSDLLGEKSPVCDNYNTWSLPGIYIMDENRKISAKPMNMDYVKKEFEKYDKK